MNVPGTRSTVTVVARRKGDLETPWHRRLASSVAPRIQEPPEPPPLSLKVHLVAAAHFSRLAFGGADIPDNDMVVGGWGCLAGYHIGVGWPHMLEVPVGAAVLVHQTHLIPVGHNMLLPIEPLELPRARWPHAAVTVGGCGGRGLDVERMTVFGPARRVEEGLGPCVHVLVLDPDHVSEHEGLGLA